LSDALLAANEKSILNSSNSAFPVADTVFSQTLAPFVSNAEQVSSNVNSVGGHVKALLDDESVFILGLNIYLIFLSDRY
jgi:hypothetical protein